ncbi:MAG: glutamine-hydrolyzing carbamoyl-phosphate synthase small subunit [Candidatus Fermentithermobacillus carboniphilus]|uniref:Carbamoyl phosphate synthase small chain n=1 Tax=Candidatus Fermentithermobacillus carboniphilus TaxID=3085328 RepID=A0AAT9LEG4_9FIRM|nr:MAG: glutamine-hydrolyzing carbamoyl-phosphate synthase small subunit [Candidatus Fermentithermobacillus carboniphilus]
MRGILCLEDGFFVEGELINETLPLTGEVVFFTGMTGYEDALTDPSYRGQILVFSFPMLGNYGIPQCSGQSPKIQVRGIVTHDLWSGPVRDSWMTLNEVAKNNACPILTGVDTRRVVLHLRNHGAMKGIISSLEDRDLSPGVIRKLSEEAAKFQMKRIAEEVSAKEVRILGNRDSSRGTCVLMDFGVKSDMLRTLLHMGLIIYVVPPDFPAEEVLSIRPDFVFLSNGPGDPEDNEESIQCVKALLGRVPVYGICLGHQILSLSAGARITKLKYGHHGANQPVKDFRTGRAFITSQNHNFAVDDSSLPPHVAVTHRNLNDGTIEGIEIRSVRAASVQFHPEGAPGPRDERFWAMLEESLGA